MTPASSRSLRVLFAHGLESSPQGNKARLFARHFDALTPSMDTRDFPACVDVHAKAVHEFRPDIVVGSSFGGAVVVALLMRGVWKGPTLLLAQAALHYDPKARLPPNVAVTLVHARQDDIVPVDDSRALAATGTAACVRLIELDDDHPLTKLTEGGGLVDLVADAAAFRCGATAERVNP